MEISCHQKNKPKPILTDSYGKLIKPRLKVAFNKSGDVKIGVIIELIQSDWKIVRFGVSPKMWWYCLFKLSIESEGKLSIIKNPNSFVIID